MAFEIYNLLIQELELYNEDLMKKPSMLLVNKMDTEEAVAKFENFTEKLRNLSGN